MLSCKEATTAMAQELKQPVYVKPNLTAEKSSKKWHLIFVITNEQFCTFDENVDRTDE